MTEHENNLLESLAGIVNKENKTYTFKMEISVGGKMLEGSFTAKYLSISDRLKLGTLRAKLLDGAPSQSVDVFTDDLAYMIAYLQVGLKQTPSWWDYEELESIEDVKRVYLEVAEFNDRFQRQNATNRHAGSGSDNNSKETLESK